MKKKGGRPPKFREPRQPITVTLPRRTLDKLQAIDPDRAKGIVKAVDVAVGHATDVEQVQVIEVAPGTGLLVIGPVTSLRKLPWIKLIEIAPGRHLLAIVDGASIEKFELALLDLLEDARLSAPHDLPVLEELRKRFVKLRRAERISKAEILFVATQG